MIQRDDTSKVEAVRLGLGVVVGDKGPFYIVLLYT